MGVNKDVYKSEMTDLIKKHYVGKSKPLISRRYLACTRRRGDEKCGAVPVSIGMCSKINYAAR